MEKLARKYSLSDVYIIIWLAPKVIETEEEQIFYQKDKDWHYLSEESRWVSTNDESSWRRTTKTGKKIDTSKFHIR